MAKLKKKISKDFTIIHNKMVRDRKLGATERGVLLTMLSLPDDWDFSIKGLSAILPDGTTKIATALKHLQEAHYLRRERIYKDGKIVDWEYTFSDEPMEVETDDTVENSNFFGNQEPEIQDSQNLDSENHDEENQHFENPSDNIINNNKEKNNQTLLFHQETINQSAPEEKFSTEFSTVETVENSDGLMEKMDRMLKEMKIYTEVVKENIEYDDYAAWIQNYPRIFGKEHSMKVEELDEIVGMIVRAICSQSPSAEICGQVFP